MIICTAAVIIKLVSVEIITRFSKWLIFHKYSCFTYLGRPNFTGKRGVANWVTGRSSGQMDNAIFQLCRPIILHNICGRIFGTIT